jgi:protein transport protein SEC24
VPVINFGSAGVIRCRRCRTYINPYATFADAGRKWRCNLCTLLNDGNILNFSLITSLCVMIYEMAEKVHTGTQMTIHV